MTLLYTGVQIFWSYYIQVYKCLMPVYRHHVHIIYGCTNRMAILSTGAQKLYVIICSTNMMVLLFKGIMAISHIGVQIWWSYHIHVVWPYYIQVHNILYRCTVYRHMSISYKYEYTNMMAILKTGAQKLWPHYTWYKYDGLTIYRYNGHII